MSDVPSPIDLRQMSDALEWERTANLKRPWRSDFFLVSFHTKLHKPSH